MVDGMRDRVIAALELGGPCTTQILFGRLGISVNDGAEVRAAMWELYHARKMDQVSMSKQSAPITWELKK